MNDSNTTVKDLRNIINKFVDARDWAQFHSPKNSSMDIAVEAAELMEKFQWCESKDSYKEAEKNIEEVKEELADVVISAFCFSRSTNIDITSAIIKKLEKTGNNYPVEKVKGRHCKYSKL